MSQFYVWYSLRSVLAWESLRSQFVDAYVLDDGIAGWKAAGLSTRMV